MHERLISIFINDFENVEESIVRNNYGKFSALVGIISNIVLFIVKIVIGIVFGSISVLADALNNLVDSVSSIVTLVGFKLAAIPADKEHPFGHARYESISGLLVGIIVVYVGIEFIQASVKEIIDPTTVKVNTVVLGVLIISVLIKLWQFSFNKYVGKKIKSNVILATSIDSRNDMLITLLVLFGVIVEYIYNFKVDGYIGLILAIVIIISGVNAMRETIKELLGQRPASEDIKKIEDLIATYDQILGYHDLMVHQYGYNQNFATVHIEVDAEKGLVESHDIIDNIEADFLNKLNINLVIHLDPVILNNPVNNEYWKKIKSIVKEYDGASSIHDFRLIKNIEHNVILFDLVVEQNVEKPDEVIIEELTNKIKGFYDKDKVEIIIDRNYLCSRR